MAVTSGLGLFRPHADLESMHFQGVWEALGADRRADSREARRGGATGNLGSTSRSGTDVYSTVLAGAELPADDRVMTGN